MLRFFLKAWTYCKVHIHHINILQETGPKYLMQLKRNKHSITGKIGQGRTVKLLLNDSVSVTGHGFRPVFEAGTTNKRPYAWNFYKTVSLIIK